MSDKVRLQILDIKEPSGVNLVDLTTATAGGYWFLNNPNWVTINKTTAAPFYRNFSAAAGADFFMYDIIDQNYNGGFLKPNVKYKLKFTVINYTQNIGDIAYIQELQLSDFFTICGQYNTTQ